MTTETASVQIPTTLPGSAMPHLHKSGGPLRRALCSVPEWVRLVEDMSYLETLRPPHRNLAGVDEELEVLLTGLVEARGGLDVEAARTQARAVVDNLAATAALDRGFEITARNYAGQLDAITRQHARHLYASLTQQTVETIDRARTLAPVLRLDAEGAIAAGQVNAWQELQRLRTEYRTIRGASATLEAVIGWTIDHPTYVELRWIANPADIFEHWRAWKVDGALVNPDNTRDRQPLRSPWPDHRDGITGTALTDAWFGFLVSTPEAEPWVPSPAQYVAAGNQLAEYTAGIRITRPARRHETEPDPAPEYVENTPAPRRRKGIR